MRCLEIVAVVGGNEFNRVMVVQFTVNLTISCLEKVVEADATPYSFGSTNGFAETVEAFLLLGTRVES